MGRNIPRSDILCAVILDIGFINSLTAFTDGDNIRCVRCIIHEDVIALLSGLE